MHTVQNNGISKTKQVYQCGKQGHTAMAPVIVKFENWYLKSM